MKIRLEKYYQDDIFIKTEFFVQSENQSSWDWHKTFAVYGENRVTPANLIDLIKKVHQAGVNGEELIFESPTIDETTEKEEDRND